MNRGWLFDMKPHKTKPSRRFSATLLTLVGLFMVLFLAGNVSAWDIDNSLRYEELDMKVTLENVWGLGTDLGTAELKSHPSVNYVLPVGLDKQVTMFYDFEFGEIYTNGLGDVEFTNERTGELVNPEWQFVYWGIKIRKIDECLIYEESKDKSISPKCLESKIREEEYMGWIPYDSRNIPKGRIRIGVEVDCSEGDYIDGVWKVGGQQIDRHAAWNASMENGLVSWYKSDADLNDYYGNNNLTNNGAVNASGIIGSAYNYSNSNGAEDTNFVGFPTGATNPFAFGCWVFVPALVDNLNYLGFDNGADTTTGTARLLGMAGGGTSGDIYVVGWGTDWDTGRTMTANVWEHHVVVSTGSDLIFYQNGNGYAKGSLPAWNTAGDNFILGEVTRLNGIDITLDECFVYNRSLSAGEVAILYDSHNGMTPAESSDATPQVTLVTPINTSNLTSANQDFTVTVTDDQQVTNVSLKIDEVIVSTNTSNANGTYVFSETITEGYHNWSILAYDNNSASNQSLAWHYNYTQPPIFLTQQVPAALYSSANPEVNVSCYAYADIGINQLNLSINAIVTQTVTNSTPGENLTNSYVHNFSDGEYNWSCEALNYETSTSSANRTFTIDSSSPSFAINSGSVGENYSTDGLNHTINLTITDTGLSVCWYNYNSTNSTFSCTSGTSVAINFTHYQNNNTVIFYANDTTGNINTTTVTWNNKLYLISETYVESTVEGAINVFNITFNSSVQITTAYLNYNATAGLGSISSSGETYTLSKSQQALEVSALSNVSFFWEITRSDSFTYNTTSQNQSVSSVDVNATCTGMYYLLNLTLLNEKTQAEINGTTENSLIKVDLDLYTSSSDTKLLDFYGEFLTTNPVPVCISENLSTGATYLLDMQVQYSTDNHSVEYYNVESFALSESTLGKNTNLYDLDTASTQKFRILARDTAYLPIANGLIQIERKYLENGTFYVTEIPKTDESGITSASLEVDDVIYNFYVYLSGTLQYSITNVLAICQTPTIIECEIDLNDFLTGIDIPDFEEGDDFNFTLSYNETSRIISSVFAIPTGTPSSIELVVTSQDSLGTSVCTDSLTSASGTLTCTIPSTFGNSSVIAKLYKDSVEQGKGAVNLDQSSSDIYGVSLVLIGLMVMMTLIGLAITDNPVVSAALLFVGVVLLFGMSLVESTGFYGATASILYLGIALVLIMVKAGRRN